MRYIGQSFFFLFFSFFCSVELWATLALPNLKEEGEVNPPSHAFIDPKVDYERFMGRVSDRNPDGKIVKVKLENNNAKFLRAGDQLYFRVNNHDTDNACRATVRSVEDYYVTMFIHDLHYCWPKKQYFPRGLQLNFASKIMGQRVFEASKYREMLLLRKEGFLRQLNEINNFLWTFEEQKMKRVAHFDEQINELLKQKQRAVDDMLAKKQESLVLQTELRKKLFDLDDSLKYYRIERNEYLTDRWNMDHDTGLPFGQRPMDIRER